MSVKKNFFYQMIYEVFVVVLPFITSPYLARVIGAAGVGEYSYYYSIAFYFVLFAMLGIKNYGNREIAKVRDDCELKDTLFSDILCVHLIVSFVVSLVYILYIIFISKEKFLAFTQLFFVLSAAADISWFYFGIEQFKTTVMRSTIIRVINVVLIFVFVRNAEDTWKYCLIMSVSTFISQLVLWVPIRKHVTFKKPNLKNMVGHIKPLIILFLPAIAVSLYKYMDKIMIGDLSSKTELGYYTNAEKVLNIPLTIVGTFGTVMLPKMSNLVGTKNEKKSSRYIKLSVQMIMCLAFALAYGISSVATLFSVIFWGDEFEPCGMIISLLAITLPFVAFANILRTQFMIPNRMDVQYTVSVFVGAILNIIVNLLLIPEYGAKGAVVGTIIAEIAVFIAHCFSVRKQLPVGQYVLYCIFYIVSGAIMWTVVCSFGNTIEHRLLQFLVKILLGGSVYIVLNLLYFYMTKNELFMQLLNKYKRKHV